MYDRSSLLRVAVVALLIVAAVACAGCATSSPSGGSPTVSPSPALPQATASGQVSLPVSAVATTGSAAALQGNSTVAIQNFAFVPSALTVPVGTTVTWTNLDSAPHTVTSTSSPSVLNSPTLHTGDTYHYTFTSAGSYSYQCTIHPFMTGTVTVTP